MSSSFHKWVALWIFVLTCQVTLAQDKNITCEFKNKSLRHILTKVKKEHKVKFAYDSKAMNSMSTSLSIQNASETEFLNELLKGTAYRFEKINETFVIRKQEVSYQSTAEPTRYNFKLFGTIKDAESGEVLPYANVGFIGTSLFGTSSLDGHFGFNRVPNDTLTFAVSYLGYRPFKIRVSELAKESTDIRLERNNTHLPAIDIVAELPRMIRTWDEAGHIELDPINMRSISNYGHPDIFKTLQFTPGVGSNDGTNSDLNIRGGGNDENLILWDGFTIYHLDHLFGAFSTINPEVVKNVQLYKSSYSAKYGGRSSGVLDLTGKSGDKNAESLTLTADLVGLGVSAETPLVDEKLSLLVAFRRSMSDFWTNGLYDDIFNTIYNENVANQPGVSVERNEVDPVYYFFDVNSKLDLKLSDKERLSLSFFHGGDVYNNRVHNQYLDTNGPVPVELNDFIDDEATWGNTGLGLVWSRRWSERSNSRTSIGSSDYRSDYFFSRREEDFSIQGNDFEFDSDQQQNGLRDITFKHAHHFKNIDGHELELGYQLSHLSLRYSDYQFIPFDNAYLNDSSVSTNVHTLYFDQKRKIGKFSVLQYGARLSSNSYTDRLYFEPRISFTQRLSDDLTVNIAGGNYIQMVRRLAEQNIFLNQPDLWVLSDGEGFQEIRSFQATAALNWRNKGWVVNVEPYFKRVQGTMLNRQQTRLLSTFGNTELQFLNGLTNITGIDLFVQRTFGPHSGWLGYSYSKTDNIFDEINEGQAFSSAFNKLNDLKGIYTFKYRDWELGTTAIYSSGYVFTPLLTSFELANGDYAPLYGSDLSARLPDFFRWDVNFSRSFSWNHVDLTLSAGVYNITDRTNVKDRIYAIGQVRQVSGEELIINESDLQLLGIRPNFSLRLSLK